MPSKRVLSLFLLMIIGSLFAYLTLSNHSKESLQSSSIEVLPKKTTIVSDAVTNDVQTSANKVNTELKHPSDSEADSNKLSTTIGQLTLSGTITNQSGQALMGVFIYSKGEFPPIFSDANGQYQVSFNQSGFTELLMNVSLKGYEKQKMRIARDAFGENTAINLDITLADELDTKTTTSFNGKVIDRNGKGVANQQIHLITLGDYSANEVRYFEFARTEDSGRFVLNDVSINTRYQLVVLAGNGYDRLEVDDIWVSKDTPDLELIVEDIQLTTVTGQALDRDGVPLPNLTLTAKNNPNNNTGDHYSIDFITDESGGFVLENFPEGQVTFSMQSPFEVEITGFTISEMNAETLILPIDIGSHFVSGVVTNNEGEAIQGVIVTLQSTYSNNGLNSHSVRPLKSDTAGRFAFENFGSDRHYISIFAKGFKKQSIVHEPHLSDTQLEIVLERH